MGPIRLGTYLWGSGFWRGLLPHEEKLLKRIMPVWCVSVSSFEQGEAIQTTLCCWL